MFNVVAINNPAPAIMVPVAVAYAFETWGGTV